MQVDSVGVKEQPKLKKVRNIIITSLQEQPKLTMIGFDNGDHYIDDNSEKIDGGVNDFDYD